MERARGVSSLSSRLVVSVLALLLVGVAIAEAFPFPKSSGVTELTPSSFKSFLSTHKPVYVLFYAPWCGHCKSIHPEWEKFAKAVSGTIRVGAVNADQHRDLGQQFGVRGFPTIKYWNVGDKAMHRALEYDGPRQAAALQSRAMAAVPTGRVQTALHADALRAAVRASPLKRIAVLFSAKSSVPPLFAVLAHSPRLKALPFYFAGADARDAAAAFGLTAPPAIAVLEWTAPDEVAAVRYADGPIAYAPIAKFLLAAIGADEEKAETAETSEKGEKGEKGEETAASHKPAMPVRPTRLTPQGMEDFCLPSPPFARGVAPLCVISVQSDFALDAVHVLFAHEPFVFLEAHQERERATLLEILRGAKVGLPELANAMGDGDGHQVLLLRASKHNTLRYKLLEKIESQEDLSKALQRVASGELTLAKKKVV